jgi:uncharacterized protein (DUF305 family)
MMTTRLFAMALDCGRAVAFRKRQDHIVGHSNYRFEFVDIDRTGSRRDNAAMPRFSRTLLAALGTAGLLTACAHREPPAQPPAAPHPAASAPAPSAFGGTDLAWIEITIAMDEQLLPLLALAPGHAAQPRVRAAAVQVKAFTDAELASLRALHDEARLPTENPHEGMQMPGMVAPEQVAAAEKLNGAAFDTEFVTRLRGHLEQGATLAASETKAGRETRTQNLALQVSRTRAEALKALQ